MRSLKAEALSAEALEKFERLLQTWSAMMEKEADRILPDYHEKQEAMQLAAIRLFRNRDKIGDPTSTDAANYCFTAIRNAAIDQLRKRKGEIPIHLLTEDLVEEDQPQPKDLARDKARLAVEDSYPSLSPLAHCLDQLKEQERRVLYLRIVLELTQEECAKDLKMTPSGVAKLEQRAKKKLRKICENEGIS